MKYPILFSILLPPALMAQPPSAPQKGVILESLTWLVAEKLLDPDTVVVIPLGVASKGSWAPSSPEYGLASGGALQETGDSGN